MITHFSNVLWKYSCRTKQKIFCFTLKCSKKHLSLQNPFYRTKRCISSPRHLSVCDISDQSREIFHPLARKEIRDKVYVKFCWCTQSQHSAKVQVRPCVLTPLLHRTSNLKIWQQEAFHSAVVSCSDTLTLLMELLKLSITLVQSFSPGHSQPWGKPESGLSFSMSYCHPPLVVDLEKSVLQISGCAFYFIFTFFGLTFLTTVQSRYNSGLKVTFTWS